MAIKTILVPVNDSPSSEVGLELALRAGKALQGHVCALHVRLDPKHALPLLSEGMSGAMIEDMIHMAEQDGEKQATAAKRLFTERIAIHDVPLNDSGPLPAASWLELVGRKDELLAQLGRTHDLIVTPKPLDASDVTAEMDLNAALFDGARPVLVAPPELPDSLGSRVVIAWNGSTEAARAVAGARSFLQAADSVHLFVAETDGAETDGDDLSGHIEALVKNLKYHQIEAQLDIIPASGRAVGPALVAKLNDVDADLLVMGAYTHPRLWQVILGGVTRHVLDAVSIPVLMAH